MTPSDLPVPGRSAAPTVAYGVGAIHNTPRIVEELSASRVLLVCGQTSFEASGAAEMLPDVERVAMVQRWSDFQPNTDSEDVAIGLDILRDYRPDLVLGIGGGSAMDMAKLLVSYDGLAPRQVVAAVESGRKAEHRSAQLVLAPTTSGSGAEATHFAVVYIGDEKYSISGPAMRADAIILDPSLSLSGSRYQRATSGIDAVAQAIESLWAVGATGRSRRFARHALRLLLPAIEAYVNDPDEISARAMTIGSHLAGRAIDISKTTAAHALSYGITKRHGVSHGHAVALTLGPFIAAHGQLDSIDLQPDVSPADHARSMREILDRIGAEGPEDACARFTGLLTRLGLEPSLTRAESNTVAVDIEALVASVNAERLSNNPAVFDARSLTELVSTCC